MLVTFGLLAEVDYTRRVTIMQPLNGCTGGPRFEHRLGHLGRALGNSSFVVLTVTYDMVAARFAKGLQV